MEYRTLGRTGLKVSELCLGTMTFGWSADEKTSFDIMSAAFDGGINFFDTADIYSRWVEGNSGGESETIIGKWLAGRPRHQVVIASKVRGRMWDGPNGEGLSRVHIMKAVEDSLKRLNTDYIDLYQVHWPDWETPLDETLRALDDLVRQGKVRYIGASNYPAWLLCKSLWISDVNGLVRFECLQPHYNLLHRAEFERELQPLCRDQEIGVIPYSPLARGFLTGKYRRDHTPPPNSRAKQDTQLRQMMTERNFAVVDKLIELGNARGKTPAQMALGWLLTNPVITSPIIGARTVEQVHESLGAVGLRLSDEEMAILDEMTSWEE